MTSWLFNLNYGPEARGSSKAEAIISDEPIHFGRNLPEHFTGYEPGSALNKYTADCDASTTVITDTLFVHEVPGTLQ